MIALSVNLNKIALIRNSRPGDYPSVTQHAADVLIAGANGITVHPRPDQRHIRATDAAALQRLLQQDFEQIELNIEGNPFAGPCASDRDDVEDYPGFMALVMDNRPSQCTLVPDTDSQLTSDHGFDLHQDADALSPLIAKLKSHGIRVSLFMDPNPEQIKLAAQLGADRIELYTGPYAAQVAAGTSTTDAVSPYLAAAHCALDSGLGLNAGHDLNLHNLTEFARLPGLQEVSIGHAFTVDALRLGLQATVRAYQHCLGNSVD